MVPSIGLDELQVHVPIREGKSIVVRFWWEEGGSD
jgi:hypothetical protein